MARLARTTLLALFLLVESTGVAAADPSVAKDLFKRGQTAFAMGRYAEAAHLFEQSYEESKAPALLWNIASAYVRQFDVEHDPAVLRRARSVYENFSVLTRDAKEKQDGQRAVESIDAQLQQLELAAPAIAAPVVAPVVVAPIAAPPAAAPVYKKWWLWTVLAAVVIVGVGVGVGTAFALPNDAATPSGTVGSLSVSF